MLTRLLASARHAFQKTLCFGFGAGAITNSQPTVYILPMTTAGKAFSTAVCTLTFTPGRSALLNEQGTTENLRKPLKPLEQRTANTRSLPIPRPRLPPNPTHARPARAPSPRRLHVCRRRKRWRTLACGRSPSPLPIPTPMTPTTTRSLPVREPCTLCCPWGCVALIFEGHSSDPAVHGEFVWFTQRRLFGLALLATFLTLVGASIRVYLFYILGVENVELVVGAATVLFAPDVVRLNRGFSRGCRDRSARNSLYRPHHPFCLFSWFFYQLDRSDAPPALFISFGGFSSSI